MCLGGAIYSLVGCNISSEPSEAKQITNSESKKADKVFQKLASGVEYNILRVGHGESISNGQTVVANVAGYANDKEFINTWNKNYFEFIEVDSLNEPKGLMEALRTFKIGTVAEVIIPSELAFKNDQNGIPAHTKLTYRLELMQVKETIQKKDTTGIPAKHIGTGIILYQHKKGLGKRIKAGDKVKVHYTGYLKNGEVFDNSYQKNVPIEIEVGLTQVIMGWQEVLVASNRGDHITVVIPSYLGYGTEGRKGAIPPNADLVFDMEILP